ncbi:MAG: helicase HerA-like domain-containing protein [Pseudomonadota bacterium]
MTEHKIFIGKGKKTQFLPLKYANRHGLIAGATGTGKTVTLQILTEGFSDAGVPVFVADVKGDLAGLSRAGKAKPKLIERAQEIGFDDYSIEKFPTRFWDLFGKKGHALRATASEMGPLLLARLLDLNETQEGVLTLAFKLADDEGLLLLDLNDLRAILVEVGERAKELSLTYGHVSKASVGAIQRRLLTLEQQGAAHFFGEPALDLGDLIDTDEDGRGFVNILAADKLMQSPKLYATFLLWLLSELFEQLPEIGDPDKPILVFFFDEAHLLFDDAPKALLEKIEQVVRLIRSKGVGVYFVTQNPLDVPDTVSSQLANRIIHALRAYTPREKKVVKAAAETFRQNPDFDAVKVIAELGVGEALVSTLEAKGRPSVVDRTLIRPPSSRMGPITKLERTETISESPYGDVYDKAVDRVSAYEILKARTEERTKERLEEKSRKASSKQGRKQNSSSRTKTSRRKSTTKRSSRRQSVGESAIKSAVRTFSSTLARELMRGILGGLKRRR